MLWFNPVVCAGRGKVHTKPPDAECVCVCCVLCVCYVCVCVFVRACVYIKEFDLRLGCSAVIEVHVLGLRCLLGHIYIE